MDPLLGMGVGAWPEPTTGFDLWMPLLLLGSFVAIRVFARLRLTPVTAAAAFVGATLWAALRDAVGVLPSTSVVVLVAFVSGELVRRAADRR